MATDRSPGAFIGIVRPFSLTLIAADSTYTEQSPVVGTARPTTTTRGRLITSGEQSAGGDLLIQIRRPGFAGRDAAGLVWKNSGDSRWRGWDRPSMIRGWQSVVWLDGTSTVLTGAKNAHAITLQSGKVLIAYADWGTLPASYRVRTVTRSADGSTLAAPVTVYSQTTDLIRGFHPFLLELPDGTVLLFHGLEEGTALYQLRVWHSTDEGATWALYSTEAIEIGELLGVPGRIRGGYLNGQIALWLQTRDAASGYGTSKSIDSLLQIASVDLGSTFTQVQVSPSMLDGDAGSLPCVSVVDGAFVLSWAVWDATAHDYYIGVVRVPDAFTDYTSLDPVFAAVPIELGNPFQPTGDSYQLDDGDLAMVADDAGVLWIYAGDVLNAPNWGGQLLRSVDGGLTLDTASDTDRRWWDSQDASTHPRGYSACFWRGAVLLVTSWDANPGTEDNSIALIRLGGWTTLNVPRIAGSLAMSATVPPVWRRTWLPIEDPSDVGWTWTGAGTFTRANGVGTITTAAQQGYNEISGLSGSVAEGLEIFCHIVPTSGGSLTKDNISVGLRLDDGATESFEIAIRVTATGYRVYDATSATTIGTDVTADLSGGVYLMAHLIDGQVTVAYSLHGQDSDQAYVVSHDGAAVTDGGGAAAVRRIQWGSMDVSTASSTWTIFCFSHDEATGQGLASQTSPDDQWPGPLCTAPGYIDDGVRVRGARGPFGQGVQYEVLALAEYPMANALYRDVPDGRQLSRSSTGSPPAAQVVAWDLVEGYDTRGLGPPALGLVLTGCNFRTATLARKTASGTYSTLASIDMATGIDAVPFVRQGNTVYPNTGGAAYDGPFYINRNALVGATVDLGGGKLRRVLSNTDGVLSTGSSTMKRAVLTLDGIDNTEAASGTMAVWMPQAAIIVHLAGTHAETAGFRLTIDSQSTVDTDLSYKALLGELIMTVVQPDQQADGAWLPNFSEQKFIDGGRSRVKVGPTLRTMTMGWTSDGVPTHHTGASKPTPGYAVSNSTAGSLPVASIGAEPHVIVGLLEDLQGSTVPAGLLLYVPPVAASPGVTHLLDPRLFMVAWLSGDVRHTSRGRTRPEIAGPNYSGQLVQIAQMVWEETPR